jgi:hypothetical protein
MNPPEPRDLTRDLTDRDVRILEDLERFRLLTTRQIQRLHLPARPFGQSTSTSAATRGTTRILNRLEALSAVVRLERRIGGVEHGSALTIWQLGSAGDRFLRTRRGETKRRQFLEPGRNFSLHALAVADVAVSLREQASIGRCELLELETEPDCWRTFNGGGSSVITLKPDLFVITADAETETHSFVEVDLGTEHLPAVLKKCRTYQQYERTGVHQEQSGLFPAVVWIVPTVKRAAALRDAIAADRALDPELFWVITPEHALEQLAPYAPPTT